MSEPKNLMPLLQHLDQRADNSFTYEKGAEVYKLVQTWHVYVHRKGDPADKFEIVYLRAGQKFDHEPSEADIKAFASESEHNLRVYMDKGQWSGGIAGDYPDTPAHTEPFEFDDWKIKDHREA